jgi:ATP-binding cassette, subfamily F, member 3
VLSGGQRSRIALARLTLQGANLLVLDEPTNHLDITSQEVLEDVLAGFPGTVLLVTHDRYLVDAVATQVWMIDDGELRAYPGNYTAYLAAKAEEEAAASPAAGDNGAVTDSQVHRERAKEERRQRKQVEARAAEADRLAELIEAMEQRLASWATSSARPAPPRTPAASSPWAASTRPSTTGCTSDGRMGRAGDVAAHVSF